MASVEVRLKALALESLAGDGAAYADLLASLSGYLRGYFGRRLGGTAADVEDLVQETLLAFHLKRDSYDPAQALTPWVHAIARYKLLDYFRRTGARRTAPIEEATSLFAAANFDEGAIRTDLSKLLSQLPTRQRGVLTDVKLGGLSLEEAAQKNGLSIAAVKVCIHRALKSLSQRVADEDR